MCSNVLAVGLAAALISATTAQAADLPLSNGQATAPAASNNWTGFYAGLNSAYNFHNDVVLTDQTTSNPKTNFNDAIGFLFGAHAGYDYQLGQTVIGLGGDLNYDRLEKTYHPAWAASAQYRITTSNLWSGSVRVKMGYLLAPDFLAYATAGLALER